MRPNSHRALFIHEHQEEILYFYSVLCITGDLLSVFNVSNKAAFFFGSIVSELNECSRRHNVANINEFFLVNEVENLKTIRMC